MDRRKKQLHHNVTSMECEGDTRLLAGLPQVAAEVLEGNSVAGVLPPRSVGFKHQARLPSFSTGAGKGTQVITSCEKQ